MTETTKPDPLPTEILVRVKAAGVNPVDGIIRSGVFPLIGQPPFILGWDVAGVVEEVVPGVSRFRPGDKVFGMPMFPRAAAGYAEFVAAPSRHFALLPEGIDYAAGAALAMAGLTAWQSLIDIARVAPGQRVLIHAVAGGVGHLAAQIAKARGAYVLGTASAGKHDFARSVGVDEVIDYETVDFAKAANDIDVVFDLIGGEYGERSLRTLRPGGLLVSAIDRMNTELAELAAHVGVRFAGISVEPDHVGLERLADLVVSGELRPHVGYRFPLEEAARSHKLSAEGHVTGKIVLQP